MMTNDLGYLEMIMMIIAGANKKGTGRSRQWEKTEPKKGAMDAAQLCRYLSWEVHDPFEMSIFSMKNGASNPEPFW